MNSVYQEPTVYKQGKTAAEEIKEGLEVFYFKFFPKYESKINLSDYGAYPIPVRYNKVTKIFTFGIAANVTTSFNPSYDAIDDVGDSAWPAIGYIEGITDTGGAYCPALYPDNSAARFQVSAYPAKSKVAIRLPSAKTITTGYLWILNAALQFR